MTRNCLQAQSAGRLGPNAKATFGHIRSCLGNKSTQIRNAAYAAILKLELDLKEHVPNFVNGLRDPDQVVRSTVAHGFSKLSQNDLIIAIPLLLKLLSDDDARNRLAACEATSYVNRNGNKSLVKALRRTCIDPEEGVRFAAARALSRIDSTWPSQPECRLLEELCEKVRLTDSISSELGQTFLMTTRNCKLAVPLVLKLLKEKNCTCLLLAIDSLICNRTESRSIAVELVSLAEREVDRQVKVAALRAAGALGMEVEGIVPKLTQLLKSDDGAVREQAAYSLGMIGHRASEAVPNLIASLLDSEKDVRLAAAWSLGATRSNPKKSVAALREYLSRISSDEDAVAAATSLGRFGTDAKGAIGELRLLLKIPHLSECAAKAIMSIDHEGARIEAKSLTTNIKHRDYRVRQAAVLALPVLRVDEETIAVLSNATLDTAIVVRRDAIVELGKVGFRARASLPFLFVAVNDEDSDVRKCALNSIKLITSQK